MNSFHIFCMILGEFIGTFMLLFFGCMLQVPMLMIPTPLMRFILFGLLVMMIIQVKFERNSIELKLNLVFLQTVGHISYAILNPAVTIAAVTNNLISVKVILLEKFFSKLLKVSFIRWEFFMQSLKLWQLRLATEL